MAKRMQHCFWCGEKLGVYETWPGDVDHCHKQECSRQARYALQEQDADARDRADQDNYERYR